MPDLPTKEETVERASKAVAALGGYRGQPEAEAALDALTVPDLLALLREQGCQIDLYPNYRDQSRPGWRLTEVWLPRDIPDD